jgi:hypothetical protein
VVLPVPLGASLSAITVDSEGVVYAGGGSGNNWSQAGIFKSTDEGTSWRAVNRGIADFQVGGLAASGTTVFAGTSSLLRSDDRGATWQSVVQGSPPGLWRYISAQGALVMVASDYGGSSYLVSADGGKTFTRSPFAALQVSSVEVLAAGSIILRGGESGVLRSSDKGVSFSAVQGINNGGSLAAQVRCDGVSTCYAVAHNTPNWTDPSVLLKSTDAGASWAPLALGSTPNSVFAVSDTGRVYVETKLMIARSDDGGATFNLVHRPTTTGAYEPNCNGPFVARGDKLFAACSNGVYRSSDKAQHWQAASGSPNTGAITGRGGMLLVDATAASLGPSGDIYMIGGEQSVLRRSSDGGWTWQALGSYFAAGPACVVTAAGALMCTNVSAPSGTLAVGRSDDHGVSWHAIPIPAGATPSSPIAPVWIASGAGSVYLAGNGVARSSDGGQTFQYLANSPNVTRLQVLRNGHLLALASAGATGYRSSDQGTTWQSIDRLYGLPVVEEASGRLIRYTLGSGVEASSDEGVTWSLFTYEGIPAAGGMQLPMAADGAGHVVVFGTPPGPVVANLNGTKSFMPLPDPIPNPVVIDVANDKQGRLIVSTAGGLFRLESDANPGPAMPPGGGGGPAAPAPRALSMVLENAPWMLMSGGGGAPTLAIDANQRLYRMAQTTIYAIDGATISPYLTVAEMTSSAGLGMGAWFTDIDTGPDGQLYVMAVGNLTGSTVYDLVVRSSAAHQATLWRTLPTTIAMRMGVIGTANIGVIDRAGLSTFTATAGKSVYGPAALTSLDPCGTQHLATNPSGAFLYQPGCLGSGILLGKSDGSGIAGVPTPSDVSITGGFTCSARDPAGGFFVMAKGQSDGGPRLYHLAESGAGGLVHVRTEPSFGEARLARGGGSQFSACTMAVSSDGTIYVDTLKEIWKVAP